jgi:hypothetical protein
MFVFRYMLLWVTPFIFRVSIVTVCAVRLLTMILSSPPKFQGSQKQFVSRLPTKLRTCVKFGFSPCVHNQITFICTSVPGHVLQIHDQPAPLRVCLNGSLSWGTCQQGMFLCRCDDVDKYLGPDESQRWRQPCILQRGRMKHSMTQNATSSENLLPSEVAALLPTEVRSRFESSLIEEVCSFRDLAKNNQALATAQVIGQSRQCSVNFICEDSCGGIADRVKGLSGAVIRAVALGCRFKVSISHPVDIYPNILTTSRYTSAVDFARSELWNITSSHLNLKIFNDYTKSWSFCSWQNYSTVNVRSNVPGPIETCERRFDVVDSWLHRSRGPNLGGLYGCTWWYLFSTGSYLTNTIHEELVKFKSWKLSRGRESQIVIGVHLRFGDAAFSGGASSNEFRERLWGCVDFLEKALAARDSTIFIASDDVHTKFSVMKDHSRRVYASHYMPYHVDDLVANANVSDPVSGTLVSLMELFILSFSHGLVISDGFYGNLAGQIGMIPGQNVINIRDSRC